MLDREELRLTSLDAQVLMACRDHELHASEILARVQESCGRAAGPAALHVTLDRLLGRGLLVPAGSRPVRPGSADRRPHFRLSSLGNALVARPELLPAARTALANWAPPTQAAWA